MKSFYEQHDELKGIAELLIAYEIPLTQPCCKFYSRASDYSEPNLPALITPHRYNTCSLAKLNSKDRGTFKQCLLRCEHSTLNELISLAKENKKKRKLPSNFRLGQEAGEQYHRNMKEIRLEIYKQEKIESERKARSNKLNWINSDKKGYKYK